MSDENEKRLVTKWLEPTQLITVRNNGVEEVITETEWCRREVANSARPGRTAFEVAHHSDGRIALARVAR